MPIICVGFFDQDISQENVMKWKWVYMSGRDHMNLNVRLMGQWFVQAVAESIILFCVCLFVCWWPHSIWMADGGGTDLMIFGTTVYNAMLMSSMYKVATLTYRYVSLVSMSLCMSVCIKCVPSL